MKKALLATSAIIGAGFLATSSASAADFSISGGIEMDIDYVKVTDVDGDTTVGFDVNDLVFNASAATDTGLTYGVKYELSVDVGDSGNVGTDEAVAYLSGDWGRLELGWEDGAEDGRISGAVGVPDFGAINIYGESDDRAKISYHSPSFSGFAFGISYAPDKVKDTAKGTESDFDHWVGVKLGYGGAAGDDVSYDLALVYGVNLTTGDGDETGNPMGIGFGANVGVYGATIALGLTYNIGYQTSSATNATPAVADDPNTPEDETAAVINTDAPNQLGFGLGVLYDYGQGDVGVNFEYHLDLIDLDKSNLTKGNGWTVGVGAKYIIASGVNVNALVTYGAQTTDTYTVAAGAVAAKTESKTVSTIGVNVGTDISF